VPAEPEPVRHHDEQPLRIREGQLGAEEARVGGRLLPQRRDRPQVRRLGDDRHPDLEAGLARGTEQVPELHLLRYRDVRVGGDEQALVHEHVGIRGLN